MTVLIDFEATGRDRRAVVEALRARGVGSQVHYIPLYRQPYFAARPGQAPLAGCEAFSARVLAPLLERQLGSRVPIALTDTIRPTGTPRAPAYRCRGARRSVMPLPAMSRGLEATGP